MRYASALLAVSAVLSVVCASSSAQPQPDCWMFLKRVTLTGSIKSLSCYEMRTAGHSAFSRDHRWFVYQPRGFDYGTNELRIARTDGGGQRLVVAAPGPIRTFALSPNQRTIAFATYRDPPPRGGVIATWIVNVDGTGLRKLSADATGDDELEWSPDSRRLVFRRSSMLVTLEVNGGETRELAPGSHPRWSPDGGLIAFQSGAGIDVVKATGGTSRFLAIGSIGDWSPDSRLLAFHRNPENPTVWVVAARGGRPRAASRPASGWFSRAWSDLPAWSPRGKRIASVAYDEFRGRNVLLVASVGGYTRPRPVARHPSYRSIEALSWARDGRSIFYLSDTAD